MRTLYVVGTPIGNLGDVTARAREALGAAARVFAEDTRRTKALLAHLGISGKSVLRYDAHATPERVASLVDGIDEGGSAALVTDAGMPGVSDPGAELVRAATKRGVRVVPIPGPSAVTAALAASGLVGGPFSFLAFLPRQGKKRRAALERIVRSEEPVVFFEAPSRVAETLRELAEREWLGEVTIVVEAGSGSPREESADPAEIDREIAQRLAKGAHPRDLSSELARRLGVPRRAAYQRVLAVKGNG